MKHFATLQFLQSFEECVSVIHFEVVSENSNLTKLEIISVAFCLLKRLIQFIHLIVVVLSWEPQLLERCWDRLLEWNMVTELIFELERFKLVLARCSVCKKKCELIIVYQILLTYLAPSSYWKFSMRILKLKLNVNRAVSNIWYTIVTRGS